MTRACLYDVSESASHDISYVLSVEKVSHKQNMNKVSLQCELVHVSQVPALWRITSHKIDTSLLGCML